MRRKKNRSRAIKSHGEGSSRKKRRISPQSRVKMQQAARRRQRAPKGSPNAGEFIGGASTAFGRKTARAATDEPATGSTPGGRRGKRKGAKPFTQPNWHAPHSGEVRTTARGKFTEMEETLRKPLKENDIQRLAGEAAYKESIVRHGTAPDPGDIVRQPSRSSSTGRRNVVMNQRERGWKDTRNLYRNAEARNVGSFIDKELAPSHRKWIQDELANPRSVFNQGLSHDASYFKGRAASPAAHRRLRMYVDSLREGNSHAEARAFVARARQGPRAGTQGASTTRRKTFDEQAEDIARRDISQRGQSQGLRSRTENLTPSATDLRAGIDMPRVEGIQEIKRRYPGLTDREYIQLQEAQRRSIHDQFLKNNRWAQETKRSQLVGADSSHGPDRVVFATTNFGQPSLSVPTDSLIGQYVVKRRKAMMRAEKTATPQALRGRFPLAVRDQHIVEAGTGVSLGYTGRVGAFNRTGWRAGTKRSKNYGKPVPFGSQVLYGSSGRPIYDAQGNVRYSEGLTRHVTGHTTDKVGLRVFIG